MSGSDEEDIDMSYETELMGKIAADFKQIEIATRTVDSSPPYSSYGGSPKQSSRLPPLENPPMI